MIIGTIWAFFLGVFNCIVGNRHYRWYFFVAFLDGTIASCHFIAVYYQSTYLPSPLGKCWNADKWDRPEEAPTLFQVLAGPNGDHAGAEDRCHDLLVIWVMEVTMA